MTDDPREILKAARVECAEVKTFYGPGSYAEEDDSSVCFDEADAAILALARIVAKQAEQLNRLAPKCGPDTRATSGGGFEHGPWLTFPSGGADRADEDPDA